jgi:hypothetical protein
VARSEVYTFSLLKELLTSWQSWPMVLIYLSHSVLGEWGAPSFDVVDRWLMEVFFCAVDHRLFDLVGVDSGSVSLGR